MYYDKKDYIVRDSKNRIYNFYIENYKLILQSYFEKDLIIRDSVLEYSVSIDKEDNLHIVYFNNVGELRYIVYFNKILKDESIFLLNENCILDLLSIKIINNKVHIFYSLYYFNFNKICICHNYFNGENYINEKLADGVYYNYVTYYYVDCCGTNIYILLNLNYKLGQYTMMKFNTKENKWSTMEDSIYIKNANNLVFFVTPENKGIICFNKCIKNNFQTFIKYRDLSLQKSYWSNTMNLSNDNANTFKPIIFYKDQYIYVVWKQGDNLIYRKCKNIEYWEKENFFNMDYCRDYIYISNYKKDSNLKINYINISYKDFFKKIIEYKIADNNCLNTFNENSLERDKYLKVIYNYENKLKVLEEEKSRLFMQKEKRIKALLGIIEEKNNIIDKLNNLLKYKT